MKIIHTADIHLGSKMDSKYPRELVQKRKEELRNTFLRMVEYAWKNGVKVILLCGDVFDSDTPLKKDKDFFYSVIKDHSSIDFIYLKGNHDTGGGYDGETPKNLYLFGSECAYISVRDKTIKKIDIKEYVGDLSVKGEFVRTVFFNKTLSDDEKIQVIRCGLKALAGEEVDL